MKRLVLFALVSMFAWPALAADTVTTGTMTRVTVDIFPGMVIETLTIASNASGVVTATIEGIRGTIKRISIMPTADPYEPTDQFDLTLTDSLNVDVMTAKGADLTSGSTTTFTPFSGDGTSTTPLVTYGDLTLAAANAGVSKRFTIRLFIKPEF